VAEVANPAVKAAFGFIEGGCWRKRKINLRETGGPPGVGELLFRLPGLPLKISRI
jgi:hypothetical protein